MKTLLWIDDDAKLVQSSAPVFEDHGLHVLMATSATRAMALLREKAKLLDGVLLDVRLAGNENGLELLRELRSNYPELRIVVFTAFPDYADHVTAEVHGATAYFEKMDKSIPLEPHKQERFFAAMHQLFPDINSRSLLNNTRGQQRFSGDLSLWIRGLFFLLAFAVIVAGVAVISRIVSVWAFPTTVAAATILYMVVCAFLLRTHPEYGLSERGFLYLISKSLAIVPGFLRSRAKKSQKRKDESKPDSRSDGDDAAN